MRLPRYLLLLLLLSGVAAECLGQPKKTSPKDEWRDLIITSQLCPKSPLQRLCRLMCGEAPPRRLAWNLAVGYALGSGFAPVFIGHRPNQGHSPNCDFTTTARHSLASHQGGEAATNRLLGQSHTSLSGDSCKPADHPYGLGARICEGREGYSLLIKGDEKKPEIFLIAPDGQKSEIEYWDTTDPKYEEIDPVVLWVVVNKPKKTIAINLYPRIEVGGGWNGPYTVVARVSPGPVCIVGSVRPLSTAGGESVGIASSPQNRPCLGLNELEQENWFWTAQRLLSEAKIEETEAALAKIKEPSERFIIYKEIASAKVKNGDQEGAHRLLRTAREEALKKPYIEQLKYTLIHVTAGLTEAGYYDEAKADVPLYEEHDQMRMRLMIAWYQGRRKDLEAAKATYREIIQLALNSGQRREGHLQDACQGQVEMELYDEARKTAALIIHPDFRRLCEDYIPRDAPRP